MDTEELLANLAARCRIPLYRAARAPDDAPSHLLRAGVSRIGEETLVLWAARIHDEAGIHPGTYRMNVMVEISEGFATLRYWLVPGTRSAL